MQITALRILPVSHAGPEVDVLQIAHPTGVTAVAFFQQRVGLPNLRGFGTLCRQLPDDYPGKHRQQRRDDKGDDVMPVDGWRSAGLALGLVVYDQFEVVGARCMIRRADILNQLSHGQRRCGGDTGDREGDGKVHHCTDCAKGIGFDA